MKINCLEVSSDLLKAKKFAVIEHYDGTEEEKTGIQFSFVPVPEAPELEHLLSNATNRPNTGSPLV
jgi:hypothetical protein